MNESDERELQDLKNAWKDVVDSLEVTPVVYDDSNNPIWAGKPLSGADAVEKARKITQAKIDEYEQLGQAALADSEPLENILKPGQSRFD